MTALNFAFSRISEFQIAESKTFRRCIQRFDSVVYDRIRELVYPQLKKNPFCGPDISRLTGGMTGFHRFRTDDCRLFYLIEQEQSVVVIVALQPIRRGK